MIPNFLVIGAQKSGTTWLYDRLRRHPDIFMPKVKEIHFFNRRDSNLEFRRNYEKHDVEWYRDHFRRRNGERAIGEATPMYLCDEAAPGRIRKHLPDVKLIACLRHPTDRAYSHYWMARGKGHTEKSFRQIVRARDPRFIGRGHYGEQIKRYLSLFDRRNLRVLIHEELFSHPAQSLNQISEFLGIDDTFFQDQSWIVEKVNRSSQVRSRAIHRMIGTVAKWMRDHWGFRHMLDIVKWAGLARRIKKANTEPREYPPMPDDLRAELDEYYVPTIRHVEKTVGRCVDAWRSRLTLDISGQAYD